MLVTATKSSVMMHNHNYTPYNNRFTTNTKLKLVDKTFLEILEIMKILEILETLLKKKTLQYYHLHLLLTQKTEFGVYYLFQIKFEPRCLS